MESFDQTKATKAECITEAWRLFGVAQRAEDSKRPMNMVNTMLAKAAATELLAFDGRK